jgi:hypothetical protein
MVRSFLEEIGGSIRDVASSRPSNDLHEVDGLCGLSRIKPNCCGRFDQKNASVYCGEKSGGGVLTCDENC